MKISKKKQSIKAKVQPGLQHNSEQALELLKEFSASTKFSESFDVCVMLGIDGKKSDQVVRGAVTLPHGTGKEVRVAVFAQGENAEKAKEAGADIVGFEDLADKIKAGEINFDVVIATPDAMRIVGQLGQILGPRGLMPNPKVGTVTADAANAVKEAKSGQVRFRADKNGIIHCAAGKMNFKPNDLIDNVKALLAALRKAKPASSKGKYIKKVVFSSTMGPGLAIDLATISE